MKTKRIGVLASAAIAAWTLTAPAHAGVVQRSYVATGVEGVSASACDQPSAPSMGQVCVILTGRASAVDINIDDTVATLPAAFAWLSDGLGQPIGPSILICGGTAGLPVPPAAANLRLFFESAATKACGGDQAVSGTVTFNFR